MSQKEFVQGEVVSAFGNLLQVRFEGDVCQGEVAMVELDDLHLKGEVIEVAGEVVKLQVFEDTRGIAFGTRVQFTRNLLEAELGPGLLSSIYDGLQNPLEKVADQAGLMLPRGLYLPPLDRKKHWEFTPVIKVGQVVKRGMALGSVLEGRFRHHIMVPFSHYGKYTITSIAPLGSYTVDHVVARAVDQEGKEVSFTMVQRWPVKAPLLEGEKVKASMMLKTGLRIIDTQFPVLQGGTFCTPGPFGAGKTVLQHHLAKYSSVDIVVVCACGERAGEVVEVLKEFPHLIDPHTREPLINRTVIICNTSSMPVAARESSVYMGITISEYYRQMGRNVLLLADSTSRWAQALREMSGRLEEIPGEEAFPAYLASRIAEFYERSGVVILPSAEQGSVTICGAISPAGGNFEEPVTQATLTVARVFLGLSRQRSDSRRYPAVDPHISWSSYVQDVGHQIDRETQSQGWAQMVEHAARILKEGDEIGRRMEVVGEEGTAIDDLVIYLKSELYDFSYLQQNAFDKEDAFCPLERQIPLFTLINKILSAHLKFDTHDAAREFFLKLQNAIRNMNFLSFQSEEYKVAFSKIEETIEAASQV